MSDQPTDRPSDAAFRPFREAGDLPYPAALALFLAAYFTTAKLGLLLDPVGGVATAVWPPTGISLAVLVLAGYRFWPGVALGTLLVNVSAGVPVLAACGMATGNTLEALLGTWFLRRVSGFRGSLDRISCVMGFVHLSAGLSTIVAATLGVASGRLGGVIPPADWGRAWLTWWIGDAMGILIWSPLVFAWAERPTVRLSGVRLLEAGAILGALVTVSLLAFGAVLTPIQSIFLQPYVLFPPLIWAALRFGETGSATATFVVAAMAIGRTAAGVGPFARGTVNESLLFLQAFLAMVTVTMLVFTAGVGGRRRAEMRLKVSHSVARVLADPPSLEEVIPGILGAVCESLDWDCGSFWKVDAERLQLRHAAGWHRGSARLETFIKSAEDVTFGRGVGMAGRVWSQAHPLWVSDVVRDRNFVRAAVARQIGLRSAVGFPILAGREVLGVMTFFSRRIREPDETLLQMMGTIGGQIGQFIQRREAQNALRQAHAELEARIARRTEQLSRANQVLEVEITERKQAEESLRQLSTRLLQVQDEERQRLARELHDSTAQGLAALSMNLAVVRDFGEEMHERARSALDESEALAETCSREIRTLSYLLHPPILKDVGLPAALRWCAEGFARRSGISVDVDVPSDFGRLPSEMENALFRIVQECLTNIQRHSGSPTARIRLDRDPIRVVLEVRDQGRGMPPGILEGQDGVRQLGVGLLGMRERVRQLGGAIRIDSSGAGASVLVEMDVPAEAR